MAIPCYADGELMPGPLRILGTLIFLSRDKCLTEVYRSIGDKRWSIVRQLTVCPKCGRGGSAHTQAKPYSPICTYLSQARRVLPIEAILAGSGFVAAEPWPLFKTGPATCICTCFLRTGRISLSVARLTSNARRDFFASLTNRTRTKIRNSSLAM